LKEIKMKKKMITFLAVAMFAMTLAVASVHAQNAGSLSVTVPFQFAAAGKTLPAGDYYVHRTLDGARVIVRIESKDGSISVYTQTHGVQTRQIQDESKLVFNKYGEQFYLSQVWAAGRSTGEELTRTSQERVLRHETAKFGKPETIMIAAKSK
jgi:frataxin-like iron-binding protein CyaY